MKRSTIVLLVIFLVLLIDQAVKFWIKTNMGYGEEFLIFGQDWARIHFVENNGMAFGMDLPFGEQYGKLILSLFRIFAVTFLGYYLYVMIKNKAAFGLLVSFALILSGALGNIIDSAIYGLIFSESPYHGGLAEFMPEAGGYAGFLYGKVVDMFYFPMFRGHYPDWMPLIGGNPFLFFKPVFNVADSAITIGVANILLFHRSFFSHDPNQEEKVSIESLFEEDSVKQDQSKA